MIVFHFPPNFVFAAYREQPKYLLPCHILGSYHISITEVKGDFLGRGVALGVNNY